MNHNNKRAALRLIEKENRVTNLKVAIEDGIRSGIAKNFNAKKHLENLKASKKNNV